MSDQSNEPADESVVNKAATSPQAPPFFQFTLRYLFGGTTVTCLLAAAYSWFEPAAIVVVVALVFLGALFAGLAQTRPITRPLPNIERSAS